MRMHRPKPVCCAIVFAGRDLGCGRTPDDLPEYWQVYTGTSLSPDDYVRSEEGTYNPDNGHFLCTDCYIKAGAPTGGVNGPRWRAP